MPGRFCFLCFFKWVLLLVQALAGVTVGINASVVAYAVSVKSRIAIFLMRPS